MSMPTLPVELIQSIFFEVDPYTLACLSLVNSEFNIIAQHPLIWRSHFLDMFDNPFPALALDVIADNSLPYDWKLNLTRRLRAQTLVQEILILTRKPSERCDFYRTLVDIAKTALPGRDQESKNVQWLLRVYDKDVILHQQSWEPSPDELQLRSQFHVFLGLTNLDLTINARYNSRCFVYDLRHYSFSTMYGPYLESDLDETEPGQQIGLAEALDTIPTDIRVNWVHMRHIHHVFNLNYIERTVGGLAEFNASTKTGNMDRWPMNIYSLRADTAVPSDPGVGFDPEKDWAGVEGRWRCGFCFCDHRDLIRFNSYLSSLANAYEDTINHPDPFRNPQFSEAIRFINVDFRVLATGRSKQFPTRGPIHFEGRLVLGEEFGGQELDATMVGTVSMTQDGEVRWRFTSGEQGHVVWSSEGIQVGGLRSEYGVLGCWTTVFHAENDPVGPFWLYKKSGRSATHPNIGDRTRTRHLI